MQFHWFMILLFAGTVGLGLYMLVRAVRIGRGNTRLIADWMGNGLPEPERYRPLFVSMNVIAGGALLGIAVATPMFGLPFPWWSGLTAIIFWSFFLLQHLIAWKARQAEIVRERQAQKR